MDSKRVIRTQVLQRRPVLRQCIVLPYVPLPDVGNESVPVLNNSF
ncbi:MAG: hypothetical protein ACLS2X_03850 [Coprococcus sp.]|nr:hypothetical protein [Coprococcus catus]MCQ5054222.1 hypothetical protein [Agathobaculum butyriciproducens]